MQSTYVCDEEQITQIKQVLESLITLLAIPKNQDSNLKHDITKQLGLLKVLTDPDFKDHSGVIKPELKGVISKDNLEKIHDLCTRALEDLELNVRSLEQEKAWIKAEIPALKESVTILERIIKNMNQSYPETPTPTM